MTANPIPLDQPTWDAEAFHAWACAEWPGMSERQRAKCTGLKWATYYAWAKGLRQPTLDSWRRFRHIHRLPENIFLKTYL